MQRSNCLQQGSSLPGDGVWGSRREQGGLHWKVRVEPRAGAEDTLTRHQGGIRSHAQGK